ncbi:hypothetical protein P4391_21395 [Bacillus thuringiensis]|uniref:Uncharacterized protein n=1 Tax=Bacillus thuringiensis serovar toumanoffi TaxID=180862 RepID=A0ABD5HS70_BACTU|nr:hypothetical protein [Bacillus thuringiensis]MEB9776473.1 hypothetical protein [Bacillus cereus]AMR88126.1 hypothetical protein A3L20_29305 [Bacillus thuringiensis]EEM92703.1 hypothetical protein bthur0013_59330 [Bacillus thuringiensis IBL 200]MBG9634597.1 hypothetical protein [Bacillus thuringiensis]MBG9673813.1 hypothetical protein [Bacillus thuringiensis]
MKLVEIEERIDIFEKLLTLFSTALFVPGVYNLLVKIFDFPKLITGTLGKFLVIIYVLLIFIFWSRSMFNLVKLKRKKRKILEMNDRSG